jgi:hypothetical protein
MKKNLDADTLSSSLRALPRLEELEISFCQSLGTRGWVDSYLALNMTAKENSPSNTISKPLQWLYTVQETLDFEDC